MLVVCSEHGVVQDALNDWFVAGDSVFFFLKPPSFVSKSGGAFPFFCSQRVCR